MVPKQIESKRNRTIRRTRRNSIILIACKFKYSRYSLSISQIYGCRIRYALFAMVLKLGAGI